jgi:hypothetical protein
LRSRLHKLGIVSFEPPRRNLKLAPYPTVRDDVRKTIVYDFVERLNPNTAVRFVSRVARATGINDKCIGSHRVYGCDVEGFFEEPPYRLSARSAFGNVVHVGRNNLHKVLVGERG